MNNQESRLHALDAVRGFALLLGVAFHASLSFMPGWPPGIWSMVDNSPSQFLSDAGFVSHIFRMSLFFFIAGFFGRLLYHKLGARGFWANRSLRILVPLICGWVVLFPLIAWIWTVGITKALGGTPPAPPPEMPPGWFPLTHLWFLYELLLLYVAVIALRALVVRFDGAQKLRNLVDAMVVNSIRMRIAVFTLGIPVAGALMTLPMWFYWQGIPTPDQSLIPQVPATVGFGTAFIFGWLVNRSGTALDAITRGWFVHLVLGIVATGWLLHTMHATPMAQPGLTKTLFALVFGVAVWGWVLGLTGAALRFLSNYSAVRRYIADASYWIYLAHLPVVAALAVWVGHWPLHWGVKYPFILVIEFRGVVPELSLPGAPDVHRQAAQRPQVSASQGIDPCGHFERAGRPDDAGHARCPQHGYTVARHHQAIRRNHGTCRSRYRVAAGGVACAARPQRRGQDHGHFVVAGSYAAGCG